MKATGSRIRHQEKGNSRRMGIHILENGKIITWREKVNSTMILGLSIQGNGSIICSMAEESRYGLMDLFMTGTMIKVRSMGKVLILSAINHTTVVAGNTIRWKALERLFGLTEENTMELGKTI